MNMMFNPTQKKSRFLLFILIFGVIGAIILLLTHAATLNNAFEAEAGTRTGKVSLITNDTNASGGSSVKFSAVTATCPSGQTGTPPNCVPVACPAGQTGTPPNCVPTGGTRSLNCTPAKSATMTNNVSSQCGYPDATNTGPAAGTVFKRVPQDITAPDATTGSGWRYSSSTGITIDTAGGVLKNVSFAQDVNIQADNVTVMNNVLTPSGESFGVAVRHANNATIKNNIIHGAGTGAGRLLVGIKNIYGDEIGTKALANNIYYVSTGIQGDEGLVQDNYIHDLGQISGDHNNGQTSNGGSSLLTLRHNTIFNQFDQTDAISLFEDFGVQANRVVDNNLVAGGGYCIYGGQNAGGPKTSNIKITNNHFARLYYPNCGSFGYLAAWSEGNGNAFTGNIWDDTGAAVN